DARELLCRAALLLRAERVPALERLVHLHREAETRLEGIVLRRQILAPEPIALLQTEGIERAQTARDQPVLHAGLPEEVPDARAHLDRTVELPSELADVADPLRERGDLADRQLAHRHVRERLVRQVGVGDGRQDLARARAPQPQAEPM